MQLVIVFWWSFWHWLRFYLTPQKGKSLCLDCILPSRLLKLFLILEIFQMQGIEGLQNLIFLVFNFFRWSSNLKWPNFDAQQVGHRAENSIKRDLEQAPATKYTTNVDFENPTSSHHYKTESKTALHKFSLNNFKYFFWKIAELKDYFWAPQMEKKSLLLGSTNGLLKRNL